MKFYYDGTPEDLRSLLNPLNKSWEAVHLDSGIVAHIDVPPHTVALLCTNPKVTPFPGHDSTAISNDLANSLVSEGVTSGMTGGEALGTLHVKYGHHLLDPYLPII